MITIYYYGHDQSEERPVDEFFRGEHHSLIQWQPVAPMAQMPVGGLPMQGMPLQGMQVAGGMPMSMYAMAPPGDMVTAAPQLTQVRALRLPVAALHMTHRCRAVHLQRPASCLHLASHTLRLCRAC